MKMAKADKADLDTAYELLSAFNSLTDSWEPTVPTKCSSVADDEDKDEPFDIDDAEQCQRVLNYLLNIGGTGAFGRVIMGAAVMLDPRNKCVDPDADTIEHHPLTVAAEAAKQARPLAEFNEDKGAVVWWSFPINEPPYVGAPSWDDWPGYHTHWTPLIVPDEPGVAT